MAVDSHGSSSAWSFPSSLAPLSCFLVLKQQFRAQHLYNGKYTCTSCHVEKLQWDKFLPSRT